MAVLKLASETTMKGVLGFTEDLVVSQDLLVILELQSLMLMLNWIELYFLHHLGMIMNMDSSKLIDLSVHITGLK
jgi:glyceraldehyde 3-phosphate dehydrogenase